MTARKLQDRLEYLALAPFEFFWNCKRVPRIIRLLLFVPLAVILAPWMAPIGFASITISLWEDLPR